MYIDKNFLRDTLLRIAFKFAFRIEHKVILAVGESRVSLLRGILDAGVGSSGASDRAVLL